MGGNTGTLARFIRLAGLTESPRADRPYHCKGCGTGFEVQYHVCPECGGFSVEAVAGIDV